MPWTYRHATKEWQSILTDAKDKMGLTSDNMAYTAIDAVLQVFRHRLTAQQGLVFAGVLPSIPRAIFVKDWDVTTPALPFGSRGDLVAEVKAVRINHNLTPDNAIEAVAWALRRHINAKDFENVLKQMPKGAKAYWHVEVDDPSELEQRII